MRSLWLCRHNKWCNSKEWWVRLRWRTEEAWACQAIGDWWSTREGQWFLWRMKTLLIRLLLNKLHKISQVLSEDSSEESDRQWHLPSVGATQKKMKWLIQRELVQKLHNALKSNLMNITWQSQTLNHKLNALLNRLPCFALSQDDVKSLYSCLLRKTRVYRPGDKL